jgi:hypothetical protein
VDAAVAQVGGGQDIEAACGEDDALRAVKQPDAGRR